MDLSDHRGPYLVTLRVDSLNYDKQNDRYTISLNNCVFIDSNDNDDNKQNIKFDIMDTSKIIHIEKGKFVDPAGSKNSLDDDQKIEEDFKKMKESEEKESSSSDNKGGSNILTKEDKWFLLFWFIYIICAILVFMVIEGDTFIDAFYFRIVTSFGVGYGDLVPQTATGKMLNCLFIIIDLGKLAYIDWRVISLLFRYRQHKLQFNIISASTPHPPNNNDLNNNKFAKLVNNRNFLIYILVLLGLFFLSGSLVMGLGEGHYWLDAIAWNFVTLSQVGYGDVTPITNTAKIFTIFYIMFGYILLLSLAVIIFDKFMGKIDDKNKQKVDKIELASLLS